MATYRVYLAYPSTPAPVWNWAETVVAANEQIALGYGYADWLASDPHPRPPALSLCRKQVVVRGLLATEAGSGATPAQNEFVAALHDKVQQSIGSQLSGPFMVLSYPAGFNYGITYGNNAYYNPATLKDIDTLLGARPDGQPDLTTADFASLYVQVLQAVTFTYSQADLNLMTKQDNAAEAQVASVLTAFTDSGFAFSSPLPVGGKLQDVFNQVNKAYGSYEQLPFTLNALRNAIATYVGMAGDSYALHNRYYLASARIAAAVTNGTKPTGVNGGMQTGDSTYYVGYTPNKLPTAIQLINSLNSTSSAISLSVRLTDISSSATQLSIDGGASIGIPVADLFELNVSASAKYSLSTFTSSESTVSMDFNYPGITLVSATPSVLSTDNSTGWYDNQILKEVVAKTGTDSTGYQLQGSEFNVADLFGNGKQFARLGTFVISQQPTITMTFTNANVNAISSALSVNASVELDFLGLFSMGSAHGSYQVQNVHVDTSSGSATVTFGPPAAGGSVPLSAQVAYVLGGVASYPPNDM